MSARESYILTIKWEVPNMPPVVGPFESVSDAEEFAQLNVPNGEWQVEQLHYPYSRSIV